jgi:hypothetical protein
VEFFEKVRVKDAAGPEYAGRDGVVSGISEGTDGVTYCAVKLDGDEVVMFPEGQLESLGDRVTEAEMYPGGSVKVTVDDEGHAEIVEDHPPQ